MLRLDQEKDLQILRKAAILLECENKRLVALVLELQRKLLTAQGKSENEKQLQLRLARLEELLAKQRQKLFGTSSEKRTGDETPADDAPKSGVKKGHGRRSQPRLPVVEEEHDLDEPDKMCPKCGGQMHEWEGQTEDSEQIDVIERCFVVRKHKRKKFVCKCGDCIETAPGPLKLFDGARYSIDFAIEVAASKYLDHLPLERQVRIMQREGLDIDSQTLWNQLDTLAVSLRGVYVRLLTHILGHDVIGADETTWKLLGDKKSDKPSKTWQMWAVGCATGVYYKIQEARTLVCAEKLLAEFEGIVMCDGYRVYSALAKKYDCIEIANCWSHVRRKFVEIEAFFPEETEQILKLIRELYAIEALSPSGSEGDTLRMQLRQERSRSVVEAIHNWAVTTIALPQSGLGRAIAYMLGLWEHLVRFPDDAQIPLDNNRLERSMRGPVLGRKNHYGSHSKRGTQVAAIFYSLVESAKLVGAEPKAYLRAATIAALCGLEVPLPHEFAQSLSAPTLE